MLCLLFPTLIEWQTEANPNASIIPLKTSFWNNVISGGKAPVGKHKHGK